MRLEPLTADRAPEESRPTLEAIRKKYGMVPNIFGIMAHDPGVLAACVQWDQAIRRELPGRYRELAYLAASLVNGCAYCAHHHRGAAQGEGLSAEQVAAVESYANSGLFDEQEQAVLRFSEQLTRTTQVEAETVAKLKEFLTPAQLVELAATVGLANFTNRFNHAFDIELP